MDKIPNNFDATNGYFTFVLPGPPLTTADNQAQLNGARARLSEQIQGLPFPIPSDMPVGLEVIFNYPHDARPDGAMDRNTVARELTLGVLYEDNSSVCNKSVMGLTAQEGVEGSTKIRVRVLEKGDI